MLGGNIPPRDFRAAARVGRVRITFTEWREHNIEAERVVIGSFPNFAATAQLLHADERRIHIVCAGTDGFVSYEDSLLAGTFARVPVARRWRWPR